MEFPKESQNYIDDIEHPVASQYLGFGDIYGELRTEKFKCKNCSWTGKSPDENQKGLFLGGQRSLGGHLAQEANLSCRLLYMRELNEKKAPLSAYMEEAESDQTSQGTSASCQSDGPELNMLVPEVKIRLAKERPFRQVYSSLQCFS